MNLIKKKKLKVEEYQLKKKNQLQKYKMDMINNKIIQNNYISTVENKKNSKCFII